MSNDIIICGDSWMSPRVHVPGTHFSEIFAKHYDYNLVSYARAAMSNGGIFLQIEEAIRQRPKLILIGITSSDRIEFNILPDPVDDMKEVTLKDLCYGISGTDVSRLTLSNMKGSLKSEALLQFTVKSFYNGGALEPLPISEQDDKLLSIQLFFKNLYHAAWKEKIDRAMLYAILHKLHLSTIPYIICMNPRPNLLTGISWLRDKNIFWEKFIRKPILPNEIDPGYHTTVEVQKENADALIEHYEKYFLSGVSN